MTLPAAADLDASDPLAGFAAEFDKPPGIIYLDGNSLGLLCKPAEARLRTAVEAWRQWAIRGWTEGPDPWFHLSRQAAGLLAPLLGADAADVMVGQSTTVNLHQLLASFYDPHQQPGILMDASAFPSDRYAIESHLHGRGISPDLWLRVIPTKTNGWLDEVRILSAIDADVGFAVLPAVVYTTGQLLDMRRVTTAARRLGTRIAWDCSHSVGVVPHRFQDDGIELAFGCTYKWLNGGPGAVGWLYAHESPRTTWPGLAGWFGCDPARQFEMAPAFYPAADAGRFQIGTPHILSLAPVVGALELFTRTDIPAIREKSLRQTAYLRQHIESRLARFGVRVVTPQQDSRRGGHLTLAHPDAGKLSRALRAHQVIPDFRPPNLLRLAPAPLYTSFVECEQALAILETIFETANYHKLPDHDGLVT
jgi:kynureninase